MSSTGWGDEFSCDRCGHPASYHGVTFCRVDAGSTSKRNCDCPGWKARESAVRAEAAPDREGLAAHFREWHPDLT